MQAYIDFIMENENEDEYYEIRDYLREALLGGVDEEVIKSRIQDTWGEKWAAFTEELIGDVTDLQAYEAAHGLPTAP